MVAPFDRGKRLPESVLQKAVIFERARDVFRALALHSVACIAFEFDEFGSKVPLDPISNTGSDFKLCLCNVVLLALQYYPGLKGSHDQAYLEKIYH